MAERTLAEVPTWVVVAAVWTSVWCCATCSSRLALLVLRSDLPRSLIIAPWVCAVPGNAGPVSASAYLLAHPFSASSEPEHCKSARLIPKRHGNLSLGSVGAPLPSCLHAVRVCSRSLSGSSLRLVLLKAENTTTACHTQHNVPFAARGHQPRLSRDPGPRTRDSTAPPYLANRSYDALVGSAP